MKSQPDIQRLLAAEERLSSRMRLANPGQIAITAALALTIAAFVVPGTFLVALASAILFNGIALLCCHAASSRRAKIATRVYAGFVFFLSIGWARTLIQQRDDPIGMIPVLAACSYLVLTHFDDRPE